MMIYYHGSDDKPPVARHTIIVCPAGHRPHDCTGPDWWDNTGEKPKAREYTIEFRDGEAEVPDPLGNYMLEAGLAEKSRLVQRGFWKP
jgi:hypothetical protein